MSDKKVEELAKKLYYLDKIPEKVDYSLLPETAKKSLYLVADFILSREAELQKEIATLKAACADMKKSLVILHSAMLRYHNNISTYAHTLLVAGSNCEVCEALNLAANTIRALGKE